MILEESYNCAYVSKNDKSKVLEKKNIGKWQPVLPPPQKKKQKQKTEIGVLVDGKNFMSGECV